MIHDCFVVRRYLFTVDPPLYRTFPGSTLKYERFFGIRSAVHQADQVTTREEHQLRTTTSIHQILRSQYVE
jgi:hypothetical protein